MIAFFRAILTTNDHTENHSSFQRSVGLLALFGKRNDCENSFDEQTHYFLCRSKDKQLLEFWSKLVSAMPRRHVCFDRPECFNVVTGNNSDNRFCFISFSLPWLAAKAFSKLFFVFARNSLALALLFWFAFKAFEKMQCLFIEFPV